MNTELEVLSDVVARLDRAAIAYMLTGSIALSYYAQPRMTRDIDLVVELAGRDWAKDSGSEMQLRDVQALLAGDVDQQYLERWAPELSVAQLLSRCLDAGHNS